MNTKLKEYISHKRVHAEPMTYCLYLVFTHDNPFFRCSVIDAVKGANEGYHMVYDLGTDEEYHSWQPKEKLEDGYSLFADKTDPVNNEAPVGIMKFFTFSHLPPHLQEISEPICLLAQNMDLKLADGSEKLTGLRKLLEAKDCLVRSSLK